MIIICYGQYQLQKVQNTIAPTEWYEDMTVQMPQNATRF